MSKYIHELVVNMTMREKASFKMMASIRGKQEKNYLKLYNYVEKNPVYNSKEVKEYFKDSIIGKYLSSEYNYLAEQLLKSLVNYNFNNSDKNKIQKLILYISILIEKGLKTNALKRLKYTKKLAYKNELFSQLLRLIDLEEEILFSQGVIGFTQKLNRLDLERQNLIDNINNQKKLRLLREQIRDLWFIEGYLDQEPTNHPILNHPILEKVQNALSLRSKNNWLYIDAMKDYILQDHKNAAIKFMKAIIFVEANKHLFKNDKLLALVSNYLYNCALDKDVHSFEIGIAKLDKYENNNYTNYIKYSRSLELYYQLNDRNKINLFDAEVYQFIQENRAHLAPTQSNYIYFLLARNQVIKRDFEKGLDYINEWLQSKVIDYYQLHIKLFLLIIYSELNYIELLGSEVINTYNTLKKHRQYNTRAKLLLTFFKNKLKNPSLEPVLLSKLEHQLSSIKRVPSSETEYKYFDYLIWVKSRLLYLSS